MNHKQIKEQFTEKIIELYKQGVNISNIGIQLGINKYHVSKILNDLELRKIETHEDIYRKIDSYAEIIYSLYRHNYSALKIEKELKDRKINISLRSIQNTITRKFGKMREAKYYNRKYIPNINAFAKYTKESCYWAGLLAADGCIATRKDCHDGQGCKIMLGSIDKELVLGLGRYLKYYKNPSCKPCDEHLKHPFWSISVESREICINLEENFNIIPRKTLTYIPPSDIPDNLIKYFILGYFDGDGSLSYSITNTGRKHFTLNFVGTLETIKYIQKYFNKENIKISKRHPNHNVNNYSFSLQGNAQIFKIMSDLYSDNEILKFCLKRKYEKYLVLKEQQEIKHRAA